MEHLKLNDLVGKFLLKLDIKHVKNLTEKASKRSMFTFQLINSVTTIWETHWKLKGWNSFSQTDKHLREKEIFYNWNKFFLFLLLLWHLLKASDTIKNVKDFSTSWTSTHFDNFYCSPFFCDLGGKGLLYLFYPF